MRVRITPRLLVRVVSGKRNYEHQSGGDGDADGDGDGIIRGRKNMNGWVLCINNTLFCSSKSTKAAVEEEEEVEVASSSSGRKINMFKEVVSHGLRRIFVPHGKSRKIALGKQKLGRSFKCLVSRFSGMFRLKTKKKGGFRLRKWKKKIRMRKSSSVGAVKKRFARIRSCRMSGRKEEEIELCKKRILMGEKCKPLNVSGSLHYDQNGVLLPEPLLLPFPCES